MTIKWMMNTMVNKKRDCSETLVQLANTRFERSVVVEFLNIDKKVERVFNELKWLKWLTVSVFIVILLNIIKGLI